MAEIVSLTLLDHHRSESVCKHLAEFTERWRNQADNLPLSGWPNDGGTKQTICLSQDDLVSCEQPTWSCRRLRATEDFVWVSSAKNSKYEQTSQILLKLGLLWWLVTSRGGEGNVPTPVLLPGESHGWRSLVGYSPWGRKESDTTERLLFPFPLSVEGTWANCSKDKRAEKMAGKTKPADAGISVVGQDCMTGFMVHITVFQRHWPAHLFSILQSLSQLDLMVVS